MSLRKASICVSKLRSSHAPFSYVVFERHVCKAPSVGGISHAFYRPKSTFTKTESTSWRRRSASNSRKSISQSVTVDADDIPFPAMTIEEPDETPHTDSHSISHGDISDDVDVITLISDLDIANPKSWTVQAQVVWKSEVRTWSTKRGEGTLFKAKLIDSSGVDIMAAFFNVAVTKFYEELQVSNVYHFAGGRLKFSNPTYNDCKSPYDLTFNELSVITHQPDSEDLTKHLDKDKLHLLLNEVYKKIHEIHELTDITERQNILGVVKAIGPVTKFTSINTGKKYTKCDLILTDDTDSEISFVLWSDRAERAAKEFAGNPVIAIKSSRISDYGNDAFGVVRSINSASSVEINPIDRLPEARKLADWWKTKQNENMSNAKIEPSNLPEVPF